MNNTTTSQTPSSFRHPARVDVPSFVDAMFALTVNGIGFTVVDTGTRQACATCSRAESIAAA